MESCTCKTGIVGSHLTDVAAVQALCCNRDMSPSSNGLGDEYSGETDPQRLNYAFTRSPEDMRLFVNRHCSRRGSVLAENAAEEALREKELSAMHVS